MLRCAAHWGEQANSYIGDRRCNGPMPHQQRRRQHNIHSFMLYHLYVWLFSLFCCEGAQIARALLDMYSRDTHRKLSTFTTVLLFGLKKIIVILCVPAWWRLMRLHAYTRVSTGFYCGSAHNKLFFLLCLSLLFDVVQCWCFLVEFNFFFFISLYLD